MGSVVEHPAEIPAQIGSIEAALGQWFSGVSAVMQVLTQVSTMHKTGKMMSTKLLVVLLILTGASLGQTPVANGVMSHEEAVVRGAYARLGCAAEIGYYWHATDGESDSLNPAGPRFVEGRRPWIAV